MIPLKDEDYKATILALADCNLRLADTARKMFLSPSALRWRCDRIEEDTGLNPRNFFDMVKLLRMIGREELVN